MRLGNAMRTTTATKSLLLTLFDIAFRSRVGLPLLISAGFMLFGLHLRLEVEIEAHAHYQPDEDLPEIEVERRARRDSN